MASSRGGIIMTNPACPRITLRESKTSEGEFSLQVYVGANGDLVMERCDAGPAVEAAYGHEDIEAKLTVNREHVSRVALELIADRFTTVGEFNAWLETKGIPYDTEIWP
jgi:hypothetical protein